MVGYERNGFVEPKINSLTTIYEHKEINVGRVSCHVINRSENKNNICIRVYDSEEDYRTIYDTKVNSKSGLTITGIKLRKNEAIKVFVTEKTEITLNVWRKGNHNEDTQ